MMRLFISLLLLLSTAISTPALATLTVNPSFELNGASRFASVDQAFPLSFFQQADQLFLDWQIKPGYYLYQSSLTIEAKNAQLADYVLPQAQPYHDDFFGDVMIYDTPLSINVSLNNAQSGATLTVRYQGCAAAGFCYPPETRVVDLDPVIAQASSESISSTTVNETNLATSQQDSLANRLAHSAWTPLLFLLLGIGLAFTPCVLPMYPILTSIVLGGAAISQRRALLLSVVYVQGMALTYTLLGLVVASAGLQFQAALQHPYVLMTLSVLFVALALSMFGLYSLQLPSSVQTWLSGLSQRQQGGRLGGVFMMGAISGLVCSPCTTAPLSGALLYVAQSGDLVTGGVALYALALGMGIPLIAVAVFGNQLLPKAGDWMNRIKILFGFVLLAAPIFLLERIIPSLWSTVLWSALGLSAFGWLYHAKNSLPFAGWKQSLIGIIAILGLLFSAQPLLSYWLNPNHYSAQQANIQFQPIKTVEQLNQALLDAKTAGKPVMLDFYADWCVACKEFERYTFHQPAVEAQLKNFVLLQVDVTRSEPEDFELLQHLQVLGLPTIDFWDEQGNRLPQARITGFMAEHPFLAHLEKFQR
ncbi:protein-disulfide reductase DsbD [Vibrio metschnikovii]|nr:protein-disulfide reductase DsbD [Vibrio metschnikovii]EKO3683939.1 protein-disulfide reductase DsbD [Vibrio metschnikovii]EKO3713963.1 protein-disulfide reductase DsbD [Vibrio metschnikovii]EKO3739078.1 protein-disulfide reductase DsbD [Vibrio metschnikovii]